MARLLEPGLGLAKGERVVAKIYDPLYFDDDGYLNPFLCVDMNYTHEVATYTALSDLQGSVIPKYYGSFTLDIPVRPSTTRCVRLILIEFILGLPMQDASPERFSQLARQQIIKAVVDFETMLYAQDIVHRDLHPRNIMLTNTDTHKERRAVFIDFGHVRFGRISHYPNYPVAESAFFPKTYISPLLRWHGAHRPAFKFGDWVDWDWQPWLEEQYGHTAASITKEMRNLFLSDSRLQSVKKYR